MPPQQFAEAQRLLNDARDSIAEGELLLDKAWAEKAVVDALGKVDQTDTIIAWFKGNQTTANLPGLIPIISKREIAISNISLAHEEIARGNFAQARSKAQEAFLHANESYNDAVDYQRSGLTECSQGMCHEPFPFVAFGIVVLLLIVFGICTWKYKK